MASTDASVVNGPPCAPLSIDRSRESASSAYWVVGKTTALKTKTNWPQRAGSVAPEKAHGGARSVTDVMDDVLYTYTGVPSWAVFMQVQKEGAGLRQQLQNGSTFEHHAVQPVVSPYLIEWTKKLRALQAGRTCAAGDVSPAAQTAALTATISTAAGRKKQTNAKQQRPPSPSFADDFSTIEREMDMITTAEAARETEEDGLLPLWDDIEPTRRCGPAVLHAIRGVVRAYYKALLHLFTLAEQSVGRWGRLSSCELKELRSAMAREKAAHVPAGFLLSAFTELNATDERVGSGVKELAKCNRMEVLRLNRNPDLTELNTLPPRCRVLMVCGCQLRTFLSTPAPPPRSTEAPTSYASLTTLGLAYNKLRDVRFITLLPALTLFDVSYNHMTDIDTVVAVVATHETLAEVSFQGNPFALLDTYRTTIICGCVRLEKLDRIAITSDERTLSLQKLQLHGRNDDVNEAAGLVAVEAETAFNRKAAAVSKTTTGKLKRSVGNGSGGENVLDGSDAAPVVADQTSRPHKFSTRRQSVTSAAPQTTVSLAAMSDDASSMLVYDDVQLRTTVAAAVELLVLRGLSTFEPVVQIHTVDELLPSSAFVHELAGLDDATGGGSSDDEEAPEVPSESARIAAAAPSPPVSSPPAQPPLGGTRKGRGVTSGGVSDGNGGRVGTSTGLRSNANGGGPTAAGGKRAVAAPPLYEMTSRVCIEGCWGCSSIEEDEEETPLAKRDERGCHSSHPSHTAGVRVEFHVNLAQPPPATPQRGGTRHTGITRPVSSGAAARLRHKVASASAAAGSGTSGSAAAGVSGAAPGNGGPASSLSTTVGDPYVVSGALLDGTASRYNSLSDTGVNVGLLPLVPNLVASLQQPLLLHVVVEDTYRFVGGPALKALTEPGGGAVGARNNSASRGGAGNATQGASRDGAASTPRPLPATPFITSSLPEAVLQTALALGPKEKKEVVETTVDDAAAECHRRRIGVLRLSPFDLFNRVGDDRNASIGNNLVGDGGENDGAPVKRATQTSGGPPRAPPPPTRSAAGAGVPTVPSLPSSRVLFLHNVVMETDQQAIQALQRDLQRQKKQLRETLLAYNWLQEQCGEPTSDGKGGSSGAAAAAGAALEPGAAPSLADVSDNGSGVAVPGQISPRPGTRALPFPSTAPVTSLTSATPPAKPPPLTSRGSVSPQPNPHFPGPQSRLREQQGMVVRQAVRIAALQSRLAELAEATLSADVRLSIGRGPSPPPLTSADVELDALRYRREAPAARKGRPQPQKSFRR
jgi:hypothetical protein